MYATAHQSGIDEDENFLIISTIFAQNPSAIFTRYLVKYFIEKAKFVNSLS